MLLANRLDEPRSGRPLRRIALLLLLSFVALYAFFSLSSSATPWTLSPPASSSELDLFHWVFRHLPPVSFQYAQLGGSYGLPHLPAPWKGYDFAGRDFRSPVAYEPFTESRFDYVSIHLDSVECITFAHLACGSALDSQTFVQQRPRVINVGFNSNYPLQSTLGNVGTDSQGRLYSTNNDRLFGCALGALTHIASRCKYSLLVVAHDSAYFVANEELKGGDNGSLLPTLPAAHWQAQTSVPRGLPSDFDLSEYLCDFKVWLYSPKQCRGHASVQNQVDALGLNFF
ncbi:hypothetical protein BASA81_008585 [Batrachochytrium salamandrivorans]|nr:hypothetical protein BASA81_008585 [Batrachochytrium salamandrivorans]